MTRARRSAIVACIAVSVVGCTNGSPASDGRLVVGAAFYPIEAVVEAVVGNAAGVEIVTVVPPGEAAHEYEPTPKQVTRLDTADVVYYLGDGFQPNVERALDAVSDDVDEVDLLDGLPRIDGDPHVWLSIDIMRTITAHVRDDLVARAPTLAEAFRSNAAAFDASLATLADDFAAGLAHCTSDYLVTGHRSFGYLAREHGLVQIGIAGISPGDEPSAHDLADIADVVARHRVHTIFFEENLPTDLARTIADETGAVTAVLNNAETLSSKQLADGDDYLSIMRDDLAALREGLECT